MGIRFHCPNGHKLNVKEFLVGKRAICPDCEARFIVPATDGGKAVPVELATDSAASPIAEAPPVAAPPKVPPVVESKPTTPADQIPPDSWYVRSPAGEQYGPVTTEQINSWAAEGRVTSDSLIWQTGWEQWKVAREVFETFQNTPSKPATPESSTVPPTPEIAQKSPNEVIAARPKKSRSESRRERARKLTFILGMIVLLLAAVLVVVLWSQR